MCSSDLTTSAEALVWPAGETPALPGMWRGRRPRKSEVEAQRHLNLPRRASADGAVQAAGDQTEAGGRAERESRVARLNAVEQVEGLHAEHERLGLRDARRLLQSKVHLRQAGSGGDGASGVAPGAGSRDGERGRVQPRSEERRVGKECRL